MCLIPERRGWVHSPKQLLLQENGHWYVYGVKKPVCQGSLLLCELYKFIFFICSTGQPALPSPTAALHAMEIFSSDMPVRRMRVGGFVIQERERKRPAGLQSVFKESEARLRSMRMRLPFGTSCSVGGMVLRRGLRPFSL